MTVLIYIPLVNTAENTEETAPTVLSEKPTSSALIRLWSHSTYWSPEASCYRTFFPAKPHARTIEESDLSAARRCQQRSFGYTNLCLHIHAYYETVTDECAAQKPISFNTFFNSASHPSKTFAVFERLKIIMVVLLLFTFVSAAWFAATFSIQVFASTR